MKNVPHFLKFWNSFLWWFFLANESCDILIFLYFSTTQVFRAPGAMLTHLSQRGMVGKETQNQNIYKASMALTYYSYMYMINQLCQAGFCKLSIVSLNHLNQLDWMHFRSPITHKVLWWAWPGKWYLYQYIYCTMQCI